MSTGHQIAVRSRHKPSHRNEFNSWNLFARLEPDVAQSLRSEALRNKNDFHIVDPTDGWQLTDDAAPCSLCESGIEFLPLSITATSSSQEIYVSYNGGSIARNAGQSQAKPVMEIPDSVLPDNVDVVTVKVLHYVYNASVIFVEPVNVCDWELLETHADFLESGGLLQQVCIVYPNQVLPLWVGGQDFCYVNVLPKSFQGNQDDEEWFDSDDDDSSMDYSPALLRLVASTEVIVTPKPRSSATVATGMSDPLRLIPTLDDWSSAMRQLQDPPHIKVPPLTVQAHPDTLHASFPGWIEAPKQTRLAVVWKSLDENDSVEKEFLGSITDQEAAVVCVCESDDIPKGHVAMHYLVRHHLCATPLYDHVRLKLLDDDQARSGSVDLRNSVLNQTASLTLENIPFEASGSRARLWRFPCGALQTPLHFRQSISGPSSQQNESLVASWLDLPDVHDEMPISTGSLIFIPQKETFSAEAGACTYRLSYHRPRIPHGAPSFVESPRFVLAKDLVPTLLSSKPITVERLVSSADEEVATDSSHVERETSESAAPFELLLNALPPTQDVSSEGLDYEMLRSSLGHTDAVIFTGEVGSGKTHTALVFAAWARRRKAHATVYLDCKMLQSSSGVQMKDILNELTDAFHTARKAHPCVLILDDLDEIAPSMNTDAGDDDAGSIHHQQVNPIAVAQSKLISDHIQNLMLETSSVESHDSRGVTVVFTCRDESSLSASLVGGQSCPLVVAVPNFGSAEREEMLKIMLQLAIYQDTPVEISHIDFAEMGFAKKTEGFRPKDLEILAMRVCHEVYSAGIEGEVAWMDAIDRLLEGFTPISRQSVAVEDTNSSAGWSEVGGLFRVKKQLFSSILHPVKYRSIYAEAPIRLPRGMLLYGPPGCGKSFLVPAIAKECNFHLLTCRGPELLDRYIGASEAKVRHLFARARAAAPCILFLDEFDALAPRRGSDHTGVTDRVVNQLLTFLDGVEQQDGESDKQVYILAATSRPDKVDPALLRPGRLETHVFVGYPESEDEWNDLFGRIIFGWTENADSVIQELVSSGKLLDRVIDCVPHLRYLSAADMKAVMDTAHLAAVHDHLAAAGDQEVVKISLKHLLQSLKTTRPSLSPDDRAMLSRVYAPLMKDFSSPHRDSHMKGMLSEVGGFDGDVASGTSSADNVSARERPLQTTLR